MFWSEGLALTCAVAFKWTTKGEKFSCLESLPTYGQLFSNRCSPPHVKRKRKIEEIGETFGKRIPVTRMHSDLLIGSHN